MRKGIAGIYVVRNRVNGHEYVGQSFNLAIRWANHKTELRGGYKDNEHWQRAWDLYGEENFDFAILEVVENPTKKKLSDREQFHIDQRNPAYNQRPVADSNLGHKWRDDARRRLSESKRRLMQNPTPAIIAGWKKLEEMDPTPDQEAYWARKRGKSWSDAQRASYLPRCGEERTAAQRARDERLRGRPWTEAQRAAYEHRVAQGPSEKEMARREQLRREGPQRLVRAHEVNRKGWTQKRREAHERRKQEGPTARQEAHYERLKEMEPTPAQLAYWARLEEHCNTDEGRAAMRAIRAKKRAAAQRQQPSAAARR